MTCNNTNAKSSSIHSIVKNKTTVKFKSLYKPWCTINKAKYKRLHLASL